MADTDITDALKQLLEGTARMKAKRKKRPMGTGEPTTKGPQGLKESMVALGEKMEARKKAASPAGETATRQGGPSLFSYLEQRAKTKKAEGKKLGLVSKAALGGGKVADVLSRPGGALGWGVEKLGKSKLKKKAMSTKVGKGLGAVLGSIFG